MWNFDISAAPRGKTETQTRNTQKGPTTVQVFVPDRVILATKCGQVTTSKYFPEEDRWEALAKGEQPLAWMLWPSHPNSTSTEEPHEAAA